MTNLLKTSYDNDEIKRFVLNVTDLKYDDLIENLKSDNVDDFIKIFSVLELKNINSKEDFRLLLFHLTNHSNPTREAIALKLEELNKNYPDYFVDDYCISQLVFGLIDINPNVSRAMCSIIQENNSIKALVETKIINKILENIEDIKTNIKIENVFINMPNGKEKNHAKNKVLFSLYWLLEGLSLCITDKYYEKITEIIDFTMQFSDYTIREKAAKIISVVGYSKNKILQFAKFEQNFYVKKILYDKITIEE